MTTTEPLPVQDLTAGDTITTASRRTYRVDSINPNHRAEYAAVLTLTDTHTGRTSTVAFPAGATVTLNAAA